MINEDMKYYKTIINHFNMEKYIVIVDIWIFVGRRWQISVFLWGRNNLAVILLNKMYDLA